MSEPVHPSPQDKEDQPSAKFSIGQLVHHVLFDYRGVIVDVDPHFLGSEEWYANVAKSRPPKDRPPKEAAPRPVTRKHADDQQSNS